MATLELRALTKHFGQLVAVDDLSFAAESGEFVALLGPSGCGKSTTLRMVLGLEKPDRGDIIIDGEVVTAQRPKDRRVGIVFQDYAIFPHLSSRKNVELGLRFMRLSHDEMSREVEEVCELLDLHDVLKKPTRALNVGELQQVALARTLVTKPAIILFDEPLSNLEAFLRAKVRSQLKRLQRDLRQTAVYVTHDQIEAMALADRIAVMRNGSLQQFGTPEEVYYSPANTFVAGFIGSPPTNLVPGRVARVNGRLAFEAPGLEVDMPGRAAKLEWLGESRNAVLGIRPEHLVIHDRPAEGALVGTVAVTEPLGSETIVDVQIGPHFVRALDEPTRSHRVGARVWMTFDADRACVFDAETEVRIA